ncbi:MAG TPA: hypothetical protein VK996_07270 [Ramlibacter sp.]|nr:hypothetical protein [Ramlibacter sp.]
MTATNNLSPALSFSGQWQPVPSSSISATYTGYTVDWGLAPITLPNGHFGFVAATRVNMTSASGAIVPTQVAILEQQDDGGFAIATDQYIADPLINGVNGTVVVADFNDDGNSDIFLAAENESPGMYAHSTAYVSNDSGGFTKFTLDDDSNAHDQQVFIVNGQPIVAVGSIGTLAEANNTAPVVTDLNPIYSWNGSGFSEHLVYPQIEQNFLGASVAIGELNGDGKLQYLVGGFAYGPGYPLPEHIITNIAVYNFDPETLTLTGNPLAVMPSYFSDISGTNSTNARIVIDDFNHDGKPDIIGVAYLDQGPDTQSMLQMLQNEGDFHFTDVSDELNGGYRQDSAIPSYQFRAVDLDGSGIASYVSDSTDYTRSDRQNNFIMVNDGTGHLYYAMHDEFLALGQQSRAYAASLGFNPPPDSTYCPTFTSYVDADGLIDFEAKVAGAKMVDGLLTAMYAFVNVPTRIDLATYVTTPMNVADRNGSGLIRTFAGNDRVYDASHAAAASIDGGQGIDTAVYSAPRADFSVSASGGVLSVGAPGLSDTLHNIERVEFSDGKFAFDLDGHAGTVARFIAAVFGAALVQVPIYVGVGLSCLDSGMSDLTLMQLALDVRLGAGASHQAVVELLYTNVVGVAPTPAETAYFQGLLDDGTYTPAVLAILASGTSINADHIGLTGLAATGLGYD